MAFGASDDLSSLESGHSISLGSILQRGLCLIALIRNVSNNVGVASCYALMCRCDNVTHDNGSQRWLEVQVEWLRHQLWMVNAGRKTTFNGNDIWGEYEEP